MTQTKLNIKQLQTSGSNDLATDAEVIASIAAHKEEANPHPQYNNSNGSYIPISDKGIVNGVATLDAYSNVLSSQLPSYANSFVTYANLGVLPAIGENNKTYITLNDNKHYKWVNGAYEIVEYGWKDKEGDVVPRTTGTVILNSPILDIERPIF